MTLGQDRVRVRFNPSARGLVDVIKEKSAELIDLCESEKYKGEHPPGSETVRCWALAQTHYEDAAMWAVKAATSAESGHE